MNHLSPKGIEFKMTPVFLQGILDVRIELPFPIWCLGCNNKFSMGVRYTAEKFMVGKYLSTPIYKFKMKCHTCPQMLEMRTDPQNFQYVCVSGCRRDVRTWNMEENGQVNMTPSRECTPPAYMDSFNWTGQDFFCLFLVIITGQAIFFN